MFSKRPLLPACACRFGRTVLGKALLVMGPASKHNGQRNSQLLKTELSCSVGDMQELEMGEHGGYL